MKKKVRAFVVWLASPEFVQRIIEKCVYSGLRLLNYGGANNVKTSGEREVIEWVKKNSDPERRFTAIDVGANIGQYAAQLKNVISNIQIHSFEPSSVAFKALSKIASTKVHVNNMGLGSERGQMILYSENEGSVKGTLLPVSGEMTTESIRIETLDNYCKEMKITTIDLLKIDTEGYELEVLKGASQLITENRIRFIQFEFGSAINIKAHTYLNDFIQLLPQYKFYLVARRGLRNLNYMPYKEVLLTSNYFAINQKTRQLRQ